MRAYVRLAVLAAAAAMAACSSGGSVPAGHSAPSMTSTQRVPRTTPGAVVSVLDSLHKEQTVGSLVDPKTGDVNPYGLAVAPVSNGKIAKGDLVVCDFNDSANVQGTGTSILTIHPKLGSKPTHIVSDPSLEGCDAIALAPDDTIWPADFVANNAPIVTPTGQIITTESNGPWHGPFGEAFVAPINQHSVPAFYVSNAGDGSLVRIYVGSNQTTFSVIATGFPINGGQPGSILGPSGLTYDPNGDRLYVVDGTNNALYAIDNISKIVANGITVNGLSFSGPDASDAHVIYAGSPLNGPISAALLYNGNIVLGNTLDPAGNNLLVELAPNGQVLDVENVDTGATGAIFGVAATGTTKGNTKVYFNDDNDNTLKVLSH